MSVITEEIIIAIANAFSIEELQTKLTEATQAFLENPDRIISASTGSGASYSKSYNYLPQDLVTLYTYAIQYKQVGEISTSNNQWGVATFYPYNL